MTFKKRAKRPPARGAPPLRATSPQGRDARAASLQRQVDQSKLRTAELERERGLMTDDLELARLVQRSFLPSQRHYDGVEVFCHLWSARLVGGDFYDLIEREGSLVAIVADVVGKGVSAALTMALSIALFREAVRLERSGDAILACANRLLRENAPQLEERFVSASVSVIDARRDLLTYASAGHEDALLWEAHRQRIRTLRSTGPLLGIIEGARFRATEVRFEPGDRLILCTDGLTEARNRASQLFGTRRLSSYVKRHCADPLDAFAEGILGMIDAFRQGRDIHDDLTLLVLERR